MLTYSKPHHAIIFNEGPLTALTKWLLVEKYGERKLNNLVMRCFLRHWLWDTLRKVCGSGAIMCVCVCVCSLCLAGHIGTLLCSFTAIFVMLTESIFLIQIPKELMI